MARPVRGLWKMRTLVRRRHRTWMFSMGMATLGWAVWWVAFAIARFAPEHTPRLGIVNGLACAIAGVGFVAALWSFRAKLAWILFLAIPLCANGFLLAMPVVVKSLRAAGIEAGTSDVQPTTTRR